MNKGGIMLSTEELTAVMEKMQKMPAPKNAHEVLRLMDDGREAYDTWNMMDHLHRMDKAFGENKDQEGYDKFVKVTTKMVEDVEILAAISLTRASRALIEFLDPGAVPQFMKTVKRRKAIYQHLQRLTTLSNRLEANEKAPPNLLTQLKGMMLNVAFMEAVDNCFHVAGQMRALIK